MSGAKAQSVFAKLKARFRKEGGDFQFLLERYALERLLWRLSQSQYADCLVLKGSQLFAIWAGSPHRPTRDADLLGFGDPTPESILQIFKELATLPDMPDDGLVWSANTIKAAPIRDEQDYGGIRVRWQAKLGNAVIRVQVDIGFGDAITPGAVEVEWASLLDFPSTTLRAYPPETVIAEKLEAAATLGLLNSRMKDFYDLHWLAAHMAFEGVVLGQAIRATFERRGTSLPTESPLCLTSAFSENSNKQTQWQAFLRKNELDSASLPDVIETLSRFLRPVLDGASHDGGLQKRWLPGGPWDERSS